MGRGLVLDGRACRTEVAKVNRGSMLNPLSMVSPLTK